MACVAVVGRSSRERRAALLAVGCGDGAGSALGMQGSVAALLLVNRYLMWCGCHGDYCWGCGSWEVFGLLVCFMLWMVVG